ncbi:DUF4326 domain-containing protein [Halodesulfovibrio spirochaetisodalis]|uniref:DUF4326 domain-containing protein n=1 Tax=Halodesulfovibrio spirochaetisodalis TaxID=1560234 RepID=A0A1B7XI50_9BACT|nr:hypothetical protein SP90_04265 [Halodesulfovibrio spirochaetisodalis]
MKTVLVLYPPEFRCKDKFDRKIKKIVSCLGDYSFLTPNDHQFFLNSIVQDDRNCTGISVSEDWSTDDITHAIVFYDGFCFQDELQLLKDAKIPFRNIFSPITRVINIKKDEKYLALKDTEDYEYIGRGSYWGNPYSMYEEGEDRDSVMQKYRYDFENDKFLNKSKEEVFKLHGKWLGCYCKPEACHGDILAEFLNSWDDGS